MYSVSCSSGRDKMKIGRVSNVVMTKWSAVYSNVVIIGWIDFVDSGWESVTVPSVVKMERGIDSSHIFKS